MPRDGILEGPTVQGVRWLIGLRVTLSFIFLGSATVLQVRGALAVASGPLFGLLAVTFALSILYLVFLPRASNLRLFAQAQIGLDLLIQTALVHFTGGVESAFSFTYIFTIYAAAALLGRRDSLLTASAGSILYGGLINLHYYGELLGWDGLGGLGRGRPPSYAAFQVFINIVAFFAVAILSSHLAERLREAGQRLQERTLDLRNLQTLHRDIIANIPSGVMTLDLGGRIISFNQAAQRITGYPAEALCDRPWTESPFAVYPAVGTFLQAPEAATPQHAFDNIRRQDGRLIPVGIGLSPLRDEAGSVLGLVVIFQDLTERMRLEEHLRQTDRLAAVGQVAAGIAHEIRNPLAAISGCVQLLQDEGSATARHRRLLDIVLRETDRLKLITGQFLDFARPKQVAPQPCPVGPVLEEVVALLKQSHGYAPDTTILLEGLHEGDVAVLADPDLLKQIYWNLCLNALEAMPGGGRLDIRASSRRDGEASWGVVEFADSGGGIPPDALARLFDPFFTTKEGGTGLGLSIARKIAEGLGGTITVDNRPGEGATFRVAIPLAAAPTWAPGPAAAPAAAAGG
ncbi:MAG TPA: ATP-binding protein [Candidatus Methylomirabilis sp.]